MSKRLFDLLFSPIITAVLSILLYAKTVHLRSRLDYFNDHSTPLQKITEQAAQPIETTIRAELIVWLRGLLKKFPYWTRGQLEVARQSLYLEDLQLAYAASLAARMLAKDGKLFSQASFILGRVLVKSGQPQEALTIFEGVKTTPLSDISQEELLEEKAAAFFALEDLDKTLSILESISATKRSIFAQSVVDFITRKKSGTLET